MSRGPGAVQRAIIATFESQPSQVFTVNELCAIAYPDTDVTEAKKEAVRRALKGLKGELRLMISRGGGGKRHWRYKIGKGNVPVT